MTRPLSDNAMAVLRQRYLAKAPDGTVTETVEDLFGRVAAAVGLAERRYQTHEADVAALVATFRALMAEGVFLPNSPTLMNAGRELGMLSACFVLPVEDSVEGIFESVKHAAMIQKAGGGTGFAFDRLRPTGDFISTSGGATSGPLSFWRVFSEATSAIQQGAFRRGANMGMMSVAHPDILKFVTAKSRLGAFENFNISVKVSDAFMRAVVETPAAPHRVVNPRTHQAYFLPRSISLERSTLGDLLPAEGGGRDVWTVADVWTLILRSAHATGEPGLCFIDRVNADNPTPALGRIEATNPCGEQPLLDYEACNLGSINVATFVRDGAFDERAFRAVIPPCVRFLDDVIDANNYLIEPIRRVCLGNRKIGLGLMGLADALMRLSIPYHRPEALDFARRLAEALTQEAFAASEALAHTRGCFPNWPGSRWDTVVGRPMRNAAVTTIAPTGTLSILAGCGGGIEPVFALAYWRTILGGQRLLEVNGVFREILQQRHLWRDDLPERLAGGETLSDVVELPPDLREVFATAHDVPPHHHVRMQAAFQQVIDGAISKTINLPEQARVEDVGEVYLLAWRSGCKGITVYRHGCRPAQPMGYAAEGGTVQCPRCQATLDAAVACSRCPACGCTICP